jgi:hypothetical protein
MKRNPLPIFAFLLPALTAGGIALAMPPPTPSAPPISGIVRSVQAPISGALVIFYNLADASLTRASTSADGTFVVSSAPVGVYDLIAYKKGFLPALVRLWHQAAPQEVSSLSIELALAGTSKGRVSSRGNGNGKATPDFWELRDRLPADVLREIGLADTEEKAAASLGRLPAQTSTGATTAKIGGEMRTTTDVGSGDSSISRAALGLRGGLPNGWAYALRGEYATLSDNRPPADGVNTGNSTGVALDVAPSPLDHVRVTTRRNQMSFGDQGPTSLQAHQVIWDRGDEHGTVESAAARYIEEAGLYSATARGTSLFPLASRTFELQGAYARAASETPGFSVAMTYRRREGLGSTSGVTSNGTFFPAAPDADLSAAGSVRLGSRVLLEGGVVARYLAGGYGIAPRAVARYELPDGSVVFVRGLYRMAESGTSTGTAMPRVASIDDTNEPASRRSVSAGFERHGDDGSFRVQASQQKLDEVVRAFFDGDLLTDFDSVYLMSGNTVRQIDASVQHRLTRKLAGTASMRYGTIDGAVKPEAAAAYGIQDSQGTFWTARAGVEILQTKTGVAVVLHGVRQRLITPASTLRNDSDKIAVSLAQDLSVVGITPFGSICRLLIALESSRSTRLSEKDDAPVNRRLLGGVAVSF